MLFFGPGDFSHSIGAPGEWNHPRIADARRRMADVARKHGKFAGTVANVPKNELFAMGYQFIAEGTDVLAIAADCRTIVQSFADLKMLKKKN